LPGQLDPTHSDALTAGVTLDCDSVVGVDRDDGERSTLAHFGLVSTRQTRDEVDLVSDLAIAVSAASILAQQAIVNLALTHFTKGHEVGLERNVEEHISIENDSTR